MLKEKVIRLFCEEVAEVLKEENRPFVRIVFTSQGEYNDEGGYDSEIVKFIIPVGVRLYDVVRESWVDNLDMEEPVVPSTRDSRLFEFFNENWWFLSGLLPEDEVVDFRVDGTWSVDDSVPRQRYF